MADHGFLVAGYNRSPEVTQKVMEEHPHHNLIPFFSLPELVSALKRPRKIMLMIQAGAPVDVYKRQDCIQAHFLICFLSLLVYRLLEKKLGGTYTCCEILDTLRSFKFADVQGQGFMPVYEVTELTDRLHELLGFATDYEFLTKSRMKTIEKLSKQR